MRFDVIAKYIYIYMHMEIGFNSIHKLFDYTKNARMDAHPRVQANKTFYKNIIFGILLPKWVILLKTGNREKFCNKVLLS